MENDEQELKAKYIIKEEIQCFIIIKGNIHHDDIISWIKMDTETYHRKSREQQQSM